MVDGRLMPKGTPVWSATFVVHCHPDIWEDPEVYVRMHDDLGYLF